MIVWLASYPRSGNTLLRTILLRCFGLKTYSLYDDLADIGGRPQFSSAVGHLSHGLDKQSFYERAAKSDQTFFVKTHDPPWDDAKALYIVRDGRSSIVSYYHYLKVFCPDAKALLEDIIMGDCPFGSWSDHYESWRPAHRPNTLLLRYDELVCNPRQSIKTLSDFIACPTLCLEAPAFGDLKAIDANFFRSGNDASNIGELKGEELDLFWLMHGQVMGESGYAEPATSLDVPLKVGRKVRRRLVKSRQTIEGLQQRIRECEQKKDASRWRLMEAARSYWWQFRKKLRSRPKVESVNPGPP